MSLFDIFKIIQTRTPFVVSCESTLYIRVTWGKTFKKRKF